MQEWKKRVCFMRLTEFPDECMEKLSYKAARDSDAGIRNRDFWNGRLSVKCGGLRKGVISRHILSPTKEQCRKVGANSARAIKKQPFK